MPYIGYNVTNAGSFALVDDIASTFNGSNTAFTLQVGGVNITPNVQNLLIAIDGVVQQAPDAYSVSGSTITFTGAPASGADFYGVLMGQSSYVENNSITADELAVSGDGSSLQVLTSDGDGTFSWVSQSALTPSANLVTGTTLKSTVTASSLTSVGTITTGVWNGTKVASAYLDDDTAHLSGSAFTGTISSSTGSTTDSVLTLSDAGVADYKFTFPDTSTIRLSTSTSSDKTLDITNAGSGVFALNVEGTVTVGASNGDKEVKVNRSRMRHIDGLADASDYSHGDLYINHISSGSIICSSNVGVGHTTPQFGLTLAQGDTDATAIGWEDGGNTKRASIYCGTSDDSLRFHVANADRVKITTGGAIEVISCPDNNALIFDQGGREHSIYTYFSGNTGDNRMTFRVGSGSTGGTKVDVIDLYGDKRAVFQGDVDLPTASQKIHIGGTTILGEHDSSQRRLKFQAGGDGYMLVGAYDDNEWGYIENNSLNNGLYFNTSNGAYNFDTGHIRPYTDNEISLGESNARFVNCQLINNPNVTSDKRRKDNIKKSSLGLEFLNKLNPVQYKWKDYEAKKRAKPHADKEFTDEIIKKSYKKTHYGLIAQEVEKVVADSGMTNDDFAPLVYDKETDTYGMMYGEYVGILIKAVQELSAKVEALENA